MESSVVFWGHFQPFHKGHADALAQMCATLPHLKQLFFVVASSDYNNTPLNPFSFEERCQMIRAFLEHDEGWKKFVGTRDVEVALVPVPDTPDLTHYATHMCSCIKQATGHEMASSRLSVMCSDEPHVRACFRGDAFRLLEIARTLDVNSSQVCEMMQRSLPWRFFVSESVAAVLSAIDAPQRCRTLLGRPNHNPTPTADVIMEALCRDGRQGIVLIRRKNKPLGWAIPGGFVEYGEDVWYAARREAQEETSAVCRRLYLLGVYGRPDRDPRKHVQTAAFVARLEDMVGARFVGGDDAEVAQVFPLDELPTPIVFDHAEIIRDYQKMKETGMWPLAVKEFVP